MNQEKELSVQKRELPKLEGEILLERERAVQELLNVVHKKRLDYHQEEGRALEEKKRIREKMGLDEYVENRAAHLPEDLRELLKTEEERLHGYSISEDNLKNEIDYRTSSLEEKYMTKLGLLNGVFAKMHIKDQIDDFFEDEPALEDLKKIARISFDLNGLKVVNDINGGKHEPGDKYLQIAADVLKDQSTLAYAEKLGFVFKGIHTSGDEFAAIVKSNFTIDNQPISSNEDTGERRLSELIDFIQDRIYRDQRGDEVVDFSNDDVCYECYKLRLQGRSEEEVSEAMSLSREEIVRTVREVVPPNFEFRAFLSGSAATLYEAVMLDNNPKNDIASANDYQGASERIMGSLLDVSDLKMGKAKEADKENFRNSDRVEERFLVEIYDLPRNAAKQAEVRAKAAEEKAAKMEMAKNESDLENRRLRGGYSDLQAMMNAGASMEELQAKMKELIG